MGLPGRALSPCPPNPLQNFINRNLEAKEERINKLHSEGDQLLAAEHPGRNSIEVRVYQEGPPPPGWPQGSLCSGPPGWTWAAPIILFFCHIPPTLSSGASRAHAALVSVS